MKNVGSTVVSHLVPSTLVLRRGIWLVECSAVRCWRVGGWISREENWVGLGGLGWPQLALGGPPGGLGGLPTLAWGRGSRLSSPTSAYTMQQALQACEESSSALLQVRDLGSDFYRSG